MKMGIFSVMLHPAYSPEQVIELAIKTGYAGIEWRVQNDGHLPLTELSTLGNRIVAQASQVGLETYALASYIPLQNKEDCKLLLQGAAELNIPIVRIAAPRYDGNTPYNEVLSNARELLHTLEASARETGVKALLEIHPGNLLPNSSWAYRLVEGFLPDHIGVIWDPGNMVHEGLERWKMGLECLSAYLAHVHVKNAGWALNDEGKWRPIWTQLSNGVVDWVNALEALRSVGYDGWLSLEDFWTDEPVEKRLVDSANYLKSLL